jgi:hypothetical protein
MPNYNNNICQISSIVIRFVTFSGVYVRIYIAYSGLQVYEGHSSLASRTNMDNWAVHLPCGEAVRTNSAKQKFNNSDSFMFRSSADPIQERIAPDRTSICQTNNSINTKQSN